MAARAHAAASAAIAAAICFVAAVAWPAAAAARELVSGGALPSTFDGAATLLTTVAWALAATLACTLVGWVVGRAMRGARSGRWLLGASIVAAALPPYAVYWTWWEAAGPGSALGDWASAQGHVVLLRQALLAVGLVSWAWPLAAWAVAARDAREESTQRELGALDGEGWGQRIARAFRSDRSAMALGAAVTFFVVAGSTVSFDLAQVSTFGFELRTLDVQGTPAGTVLRAGLPAIVLAAIGGIALACWPVRPREDPVAPPRPARARAAWALVALTLVLPVAVLIRALLTRGALQDFAPVALRGAGSTFAAAFAAGIVAVVIAAGHLALASLGLGRSRAARAARLAERTMLVGWVLAATVPGTIAALALAAAYNHDLLGPPVYDTPVIMVLAHLARFGAVAAWLGRMSALREPRERRDLRTIDGGEWRGLFPALAPQLRAASLAALLAVATLAAGEVVVSARLEPPGWAWASSTLLNAIHYQQPATVLGALLALLVTAAVAGLAVALLLGRAGARNAMLLLAAALLFTGCREVSPAGGPAIQVQAHFGGAGRGRGQFEYPRVLEIDPRDGTILVVDRQARIQRFTPEGKYLHEWAMPEKTVGKPTGLGIAPDGTVWVADTHYHRVVAFTPAGTELRRWGVYGMEPGQFIFPCDVEVGPDGLIYVAEFGGNDRIQVFTPEGTFVRTFGSRGKGPVQFDRPQSMGFSPDGKELFVADACNHRIQVLTPDGQFLRSYGSVGEAPGQFVYPYGLEVLPDGTLLIAEFGDNRLQRIDPRDGRVLALGSAVQGAPVPVTLQLIDGDRMRSVPSGVNALRFPWAVGARDGRVYILDSGHSRVLICALDGLPPVPGTAPSPAPTPAQSSPDKDAVR